MLKGGRLGVGRPFAFTKNIAQFSHMPKNSAILQSGASVLRATAKPVPRKDMGSAKINKVIARMRAALKPEENGVAIAAPQIGESLRIFVVAGKVFKEEEEPQHARKKVLGFPQPPERHRPDHFSDHTTVPPDKVFINPELIRTSRKKNAVSEGCLSVRGVYGMVKRSEKASVRAFDEAGKPFTYHGSGLIAQIFQHEMDHLSGTLFIDKAEKLDDDKSR